MDSSTPPPFDNVVPETTFINDQAAPLSSQLMYSRTQTEYGFQLRLLAEHVKKNKKERMALVKDLPDLLETPRDLTPAELESIDYKDMGFDTFTIVGKAKGKDMGFPLAAYCSPEEMEKIGLTERLSSIFERVHRKEFASSKKAKFDSALSIEPGHHPKGIHLSSEARVNQEAMRALNVDIAVCRQKVLEYLFPELTKGIFLEQWVHEAWITVGHEDNKSASNIQFNVSGADFKKDLGDKGEGHTDDGDDPRTISVIFFMENLPRTKYPGRMNILGPNLTCSARRMGALAFSARYPHTGSGISEGQVTTSSHAQERLRQYCEATGEEHLQNRVNVITYCRQDCLRTRSAEVHEELYNWETAQAAFGTQRNHQEWLMRYFHKGNIGGVKELDKEQLLEEFSWIDSAGKKQYPEEWIAQELCHPSRLRDERETEWAAMYTATMSSNCGPAARKELTRGAQGRKEKMRRKGLQTPKLRCQGTCRNGKRCTNTIYQDNGREGISHCHFHLLQFDEEMNDGEGARDEGDDEDGGHFEHDPELGDHNEVVMNGHLSDSLVFDENGASALDDFLGNSLVFGETSKSAMNGHLENGLDFDENGPSAMNRYLDDGLNFDENGEYAMNGYFDNDFDLVDHGAYATNEDPETALAFGQYGEDMIEGAGDGTIGQLDEDMIESAGDSTLDYYDADMTEDDERYA